MCTNIIRQVELDGSGKGAQGWFAVRQANVSYDHPFHVALEHSLNIDFVDESKGPGARVAVELDVASARTLAATILAVLAEAEARGELDEMAKVVSDLRASSRSDGATEARAKSL
jgi:hypothetical protein